MILCDINITKKWKGQPTELEKALANNFSDKGLDYYLDQITQDK